MSLYEVEIGEDVTPSVCRCCDERSCIGHGFVYKDGAAYAIYYAGWSESHVNKEVSLALALGNWSSDSTTVDRTCFGIKAYEAGDEVRFRVIEPNESPWPETDLMGKMFGRNEAINHNLLDEVFHIAEEVLRSHQAVRRYLDLDS